MTETGKAAVPMREDSRFGGRPPADGASPPRKAPENNDRDTHDPVDAPAHYVRGGIECVDYLRAHLGPEQFAGFCRGNVLKYATRYPEKGGVEDLKKAQVYLGWLIDALEKDAATPPPVAETG